MCMLWVKFSAFFLSKKLNFVRAFHLYVMKLTCIQKRISKSLDTQTKQGLKFLKLMNC